jgi:hypothetical protein
MRVGEGRIYCGRESVTAESGGRNFYIFRCANRDIIRKESECHMDITWNDLIIDIEQVNVERLIEDWRWLTGKDKTPIIVSSIGDLFLQDTNGGIYWLNVGEGKLSRVADSADEFEKKLKDDGQVREWFLVDLIAELKAAGHELKEQQVYSYKKLPILNGDYSVDNFEITDIEVHFSFAGQIHQQVKDLPDGTRIDNVKFIPKKE